MAAAATLNRVRWYATVALPGLGLPGVVAAALIVTAASLHWGATAAATDSARELDRESARLARRLAQPVAAREPTAGEQLAAFESRFASDGESAAALSILQDIARKHGLKLEQAEFKLLREPAEPFARYVIQLPVKTDYRSLRRFTKDALRSLPGLAMEDLGLRRADSRSTQLEAQLRLVVFLRKG